MKAPDWDEEVCVMIFEESELVAHRLLLIPWYQDIVHREASQQKKKGTLSRMQNYQGLHCPSECTRRRAKYHRKNALTFSNTHTGPPIDVYSLQQPATVPSTKGNLSSRQGERKREREMDDNYHNNSLKADQRGLENQHQVFEVGRRVNLWCHKHKTYWNIHPINSHS